MTLQRFLMWYVGAVLFVGTMGAGGYQILSRNHTQLAEREVTARFGDSDLARADSAAGPGAPANGLPEAATFPAVNSPSSAFSSTPHRRAAASPPLHSQSAAVTPLRSHLTTTGTSHASQTRRLADRRYATSASTARPTDRTVGQTPTPLRQAPPLLAGQYAPFSQPAWIYAQAPSPPATYYPYAGYPAYPPSYAYYYPRYQYYRFY